MAIPFPETAEEFLDLLEELGAAKPSSWVWEGSKFSRKEVLQYLFLRSIWMLMENPSKSTYTPEKTARSRAWTESLKGRSLRADVPIVEKMLSSGISPVEISTLVSYSQANLVFQVLYMLDDNEMCTPVDIEDTGFGLFETRCDEPIGSRWSINDLLEAARPKNFPDTRDSSDDA